MNAHGIHSPFVFAFYNQVLKKPYTNADIEKAIKRQYTQNRTEISFMEPKTQQLIKSNVQTWTKRTWSGQPFSYFLLKLCEWLKASRFLETGTSLGTNLSIVSHAETLRKLYSIEGSRELVALALKLNFAAKHTAVEIVTGMVHEKFIETISTARPEVVFLDADHRSETIRFYIEALKEYGSEVKAIVIHDIYWSHDMKEAWIEICKDHEYPLTIDCFHMGIVFPKVEMEKQHFVLKY